MSDEITSAGAGQLKSIIERIERLEEEKRNIASDIKDVYAEAKGQGFDSKILRKVVSLRRKEPHEREEEETLLETYLNALGMA
ncbi:Azospirillum phage Cd, Gp10 [Rhabdaerophilaceae bacterium]